MTSRAVLVIGMHRSGTSATAGALGLAGVELGRHLTPARPENPRGFFEDDRVWQIHENLLADLGVPSDDPRSLPEAWEQSAAAREAQDVLHRVLAAEFSAAPLWGVKDPRLCRTFPIWPELLARLEAEPRIVLVLRHPFQSARSLVRTTGTVPERSLALWLRYTLEAERATRGCPRVVSHYAALLENPPAELTRLDRALGLGLGARIEAARPAIGTFLDPSLRHEQPESTAEDAYGGTLGSWCEHAYRALLRLPQESACGELAAIATRFNALERAARPFTATLAYYAARERTLTSEVDRLEAKLTANRAELARAEDALAALRTSRSWRLTEPLRGARARLHRALAKGA